VTPRARLLLAIIVLQAAVPTWALMVRWSGDGSAVRFGWHMFAGLS
jgi:hypothetical protein